VFKYIKSYNTFINESVLKDSDSKYIKTWVKWNKLVNMTASEISDFYNSAEGKTAGLSKSKASKLGINSGRQSARMLMKMIPIGSTYEKAEENWTEDMWRWANKQISFISRMKGMRSRIVGDPYEKNGKKTRWYLSLLIWGHNPKK
jgi:hypothetical protein